LSSGKQTDAEIDQKLIKQAKWKINCQGCLTRSLAAKILKIFLSDNDRYVQYQDVAFLSIVNLTLDSCIVQTEELSAEYALEQFLKCNDRKFLSLFHDFARFIEFYCEYDGHFMAEAKIALNTRKFEILGYKSEYKSFHLYDANRGRQIALMERVRKESEAKLSILQEEYKTEFLSSEIRKLKEYIVKASAKENIDMTEHEDFLDVDPKWIDISRMFLNYFDVNSGIQEEESENVRMSRQIRNRIDLLMFAVENGNNEQVDFYKEKLYDFVQRPGMFFRPLHLNECFDRFQYVCPKGFYRLFIDIMKRTNVKFCISGFDTEPLDKVPIYLACVGAEITKYEPDLLEQYLGTVISCENTDLAAPIVREILCQAIDKYVQIFLL